MIVAIVQARLGSVRFPNKVMRHIDGVPMIELLLGRLSRAARLDKVILATTDSARDRPLVDHVAGLGYEVFRGSEADVLDRYYRAALPHRPSAVVRITGDCPLVDPELVDEIVAAYQSQSVDYLSNTQPPTYPNGLDVEIFSFDALTRAVFEAAQPAEREHVTPYFYRSGRFRIGNWMHKDDLSRERWTVDEPADFEVISNVFAHFSPETNFGWRDVMKLRLTEPELFRANQHLRRNEGATLGTGQKLCKRAGRVIPSDGTELRLDLLPEEWPAYFSKAQGCRVWDLDGKAYIDMSTGIRTSILGYGHPEVDGAVREAIDSGIRSTLNCPEEVYLAERLIELHPWAHMARFARTGDEAASIAVRLGQAASGKDDVAMCGTSVPQMPRGQVFSFAANELDVLEALISANDIGVIMLDMAQIKAPRKQILLAARKIASAHGIVLIFDERTAGFRESFGGAHLTSQVEPDIATFGQALANGYGLAAAIGRRDIMGHAGSTGGGSAFTERIGLSAALATLDVMQRSKSWDKISRIGTSILEGRAALAEKHGLSLGHNGIPALAHERIALREMLSRGYLAGTGFYACTEHSPDIVRGYLDALDHVFAVIKQKEGRDVV
jgi:glutamate-1-semialdehyde 2,1-aminomutase